MQAMTSFFFNFECISKIGFFSFLLRTGGQPYLTVFRRPPYVLFKAHQARYQNRVEYYQVH